MTTLLTYLKHVRGEFAHIIWPTNRIALAHMLVVIGICIAIAVVIWFFDYNFSSIVNRLIGV